MDGSKILLLSCVIVFVDAAGYGIVVPTVPLHASELGISPFQLGLVFAAYPITHLVVSVPLGVLCDRHGRKLTVLLGMLALATSSLSFALAGDFIQLFMSRAVQGTAAAATWVAALALLADVTPPMKRGERMGWVTAAMGVGAIAGPPLGGGLADMFGYSFPFYVWSTLALSLALTIFWGIEEPPHVGGARFSLREMCSALRNRNVVMCCLVAGLVWLGFGFFEPLMPGYVASRFDVGGGTVGGMFGVAALFMAFSRPVFGIVSDRVGRKKVIVGGMFFYAISVQSILFADSITTMTLAFALIGLALGIPLSAALPLITESLPLAGTASALFLTAYSVGHVVGPIMGGSLVGYVGMAALIYFYAFMMLGGGMASSILIKEN